MAVHSIRPAAPATAAMMKVRRSMLLGWYTIFGMTVGIGVIGMGWMGAVHSRSYLQVAGRFADLPLQPKLVICADDVEARSNEARQRFGFARSTTDWRRVIADPEVQVVNITTPNNLHREIAAAAAAAGKHIYCEKPVGMNPGETEQIERAARTAGVLSFVGYNYRWAPMVQYAHRLIQEGTLGRITHYRGRFLTGYASDPGGVLSWRFRRDIAGLGCLGDLMSHVVDMAHMMAGPIKRLAGNRETFIPRRPLPVPGTGTHFSVVKDGPVGDVTNEDYVAALVQFECGAHGTLEACRVIQGPQCQMAFEVHGTAGALNWDFERMNELNLFLTGDQAAQHGYRRIMSGTEHPFYAQFYPGPAISMSYDDLKTIECHEFLRSIAEGRQGEPGFREALAAGRVLAAIERSWKPGVFENVIR